MPQTSGFPSPPKTHCDLRAGSGVIPISAHERAAVSTAPWGQVCPTDVGLGAAHTCLPLACCPLKSFQLIVFKNFTP